MLTIYWRQNERQVFTIVNTVTLKIVSLIYALKVKDLCYIEKKIWNFGNPSL